MALDPRLCLVSAEERSQIKALTKQLIKLAGGNEIFQHSAGVESAQLSKYGSPSEAAVIRADVVLALDRQLEAPMMLEFLAQLQGYKLVPIETEPDEDGSRIGIADLAELQRADGDVSLSLSEALSDGVIDIEERRNTRMAIARKVMRLRRVDRKLAGGAA